MRTQKVSFYSHGERLAALWRTPAEFEGRLRTIIQGPGLLGLADAKIYEPYHEALTAAGFGVLAFDYRGFGESAGPPELFSPVRQYQDHINAITYATTREDVDPEALGVLGIGGTGGGTAILMLAHDERIKVAVAQNPVADGADWLHRQRREHEWYTFLEELEADRQQRVTTGKGRIINARNGLLVSTPERMVTKAKADVDSRVPKEVVLAAADEIMAYRPIDAVHTLTKPLMIVTVDKDTFTTIDHARDLYKAAKGPKLLVVQRNVLHYNAYEKYGHIVVSRAVNWFERYLQPEGDVMIYETDDGKETVESLKV